MKSETELKPCPFCGNQAEPRPTHDFMKQKSKANKKQRPTGVALRRLVRQHGHSSRKLTPNIGCDKQKLLASVKNRGEQFEEMGWRRGGLKQHRDFGDVLLQIRLGVLLNKLVQLFPLRHILTLGVQRTPLLQLVWQASVKRLVNELVRPLANPTRRVAHRLKFRAIQFQECFVKRSRECVLPIVGHRQQSSVNRAKFLSGVAERHNQAKPEIFRGLGGTRNGQQESNLIEIQMRELLRSAARRVLLRFSDFKSENPKLLKLGFVILNQLVKALNLNPKQLGDLAGVCP